MPSPTPNQKIHQVKMFGEDFIEIVIEGDTFDDASDAAKLECDSKNKTFIHPFNDEKVIEGQATVGLEVLNQTDEKIDYVFVPIGEAEVCLQACLRFLNTLSADTKIIGVEPEGAPSMLTSIQNKEDTTSLDTIDAFVDGAAVKESRRFKLCYLSAKPSGSNYGSRR